MKSPFSRNFKQIARLDIPGGGQIVVKGGKAYVGHIAPPHGTSIIDVADPRNPRVLSTISLPDSQSHTHKVRLSGDLMVVNSEMHNRHFLRKGLEIRDIAAKMEREEGREPSDAELMAILSVSAADLVTLKKVAERGYEGGGFRIYNVSDPSRPRELVFQRTGGIGVHRFDCDEKYAYISTEMDGWQGNVLVNYDLANPEKPVEISKWWMPGQHVAGGEKPHWAGVRNRLHHGLRFDNEIYAACWYGGCYIIDVSDIASPKTVAHHNYHPPFPEPTHTFMRVPHAIGGKKLALAVDEEHPHDLSQPHAFLWVLDISDYSDIKPISTFQVINPDLPWARAHIAADGTYGHDIYGPGAHQFQEHMHDNMLFCTWFTAGLRAIDLSNPLKPKETGYFVPEPGSGFVAPQSNDVEVDDRGLVYLLDRDLGLDILEYQG